MEKKKIRRKPFHNIYGYIKIGAPVYFEVENQSLWGGDNCGVLEYINDEYVIKTKNSGIIKTDGYLSAYWNTIYPITDSYWFDKLPN